MDLVSWTLCHDLTMTRYTLFTAMTVLLTFGNSTHAASITLTPVAGDRTAAVQAAFRNCQNGETVRFSDGQYSMGTVTLPTTSCTVTANRAKATIQARTAGQPLWYAPANTANDRLVIQNLVFDANGLSIDSAVKFDWQAQGVTIRYNVFKGNGSGTAVFIPGGTIGKSGQRSQIRFNIMRNWSKGIDSYNHLSDSDLSDNWFENIDQGISAGGCKHELPAGTSNTVDRNTFTSIRRMAIELCGQFQDLSVSYNYLTNWLPSRNPDGENYGACSGTRPFMCDSMGISLPVGNNNIRAIGNIVNRQPGTSWGIEWVVTPTSVVRDNWIYNAGRNIVYESCVHVGAADNCTQILKSASNNKGCGGNVAQNKTDYAKFTGTGNAFYDSCSDAAMPKPPALPAMPFNPDTGADTGAPTTPPDTGTPPPTTPVTSCVQVPASSSGPSTANIPECKTASTCVVIACTSR